MPTSGETAVVDPGDAAPALAEAERRGWTIGQLWNTHWHPDHTGGNVAVKEATGARISGPAGDRIPGRDVALAEGDEVRLGRHVGRVIEVPGHTLDHIALVFDEDRLRLRRRHLVRDGLRPAVRRHAEQMYRRFSGLPSCPIDTALLRARIYACRTRASRLMPNPTTPLSPSVWREVEAHARSGRNHLADDGRARNAQPIRSFALRTAEEFARAAGRKRQLPLMIAERCQCSRRTIEEVEMRTLSLLIGSAALASCMTAPPPPSPWHAAPRRKRNCSNCSPARPPARRSLPSAPAERRHARRSTTTRWCSAAPAARRSMSTHLHAWLRTACGTGPTRW